MCVVVPLSFFQLLFLKVVIWDFLLPRKHETWSWVSAGFGLLCPLSTFCYCEVKEQIQIYSWNNQGVQHVPSSKELFYCLKSADFHIHVFKTPAPTMLKVSQAQCSQGLNIFDIVGFFYTVCMLLLESLCCFYSILSCWEMINRQWVKLIQTP